MKLIKWTKRLGKKSYSIGTGIAASLLSAPTVFAAELPTGKGLSDWIVTVGQNVFVALFVVGAVRNFAKKAWGPFVTLFAAGALVAWIIYYPDQVVGILKNFGIEIGK